MKQPKWTLAALTAIAIVGAGAAGVANAGANRAGTEQAGEDDDRAEDAREATTLRGARISLAQAVTAAEAQTGLKAMEAGIDDEGRGALFEVSMADGAGEKTVLVDTQSGKVTSVVADAEEAGEQEDAD